MTRKELDEEIEFVRKNRLKNGLIRSFNEMRNIIIQATNTYTNISLFMNDYIQLYDDKLIDRDMYEKALNDLYLLALLHTCCEEELL